MSYVDRDEAPEAIVEAFDRVADVLEGESGLTVLYVAINLIADVMTTEAEADNQLHVHHAGRALRLLMRDFGLEEMAKPERRVLQ